VGFAPKRRDVIVEADGTAWAVQTAALEVKGTRYACECARA
jgi:hypothetical protein